MIDHPKPDYKWQVESRASILRLMLELVTVAEGHPEFRKPEDSNRATYALFVGAVFSLWRGAFLVDAVRESDSIVDSAQEMMKKVLSDNSISFQDDRRMRSWMGGYYLNNAKYRIARIVEKLGLSPGSHPALQAFEEFRRTTFDSVKESQLCWTIYYAALEQAFSLFKEAVPLPTDGSPAARSVRDKPPLLDIAYDAGLDTNRRGKQSP